MAGAEAACGTGPGTALDADWVARLVKASENADPALVRSAVVEFTIGKTKRVVVRIVDGRFGPVSESGDDDTSDVEPDVSIPLTSSQLAAFTTGEESMTQAYMRGDLKPAGSTGALLPVLALFDTPTFRAGLSA